MKLSISDLDTYSSMINSKILKIIEEINPQNSVGLFHPYKNEVDVLKISNHLISLIRLLLFYMDKTNQQIFVD